jgi:DNA-binding transcriptional ArsR family regulator
MKAFKIITDPEAFQLLADETRRRMIYLLRAKERTVSQIADELDLTPQAIYHHIRKLKDAGMVEVAREERVDHFIETYYRATAEMFNMAHGSGASSEVLEQEEREAIQNLAKLGLTVHLDDATVARIVDLLKKLKSPEEKSPWMDKVNELKDVSFLGKQSLLEYVNLVSMSDKDFEERLKRERDLRKILQGIVAEPVAVKKS